MGQSSPAPARTSADTNWTVRPDWVRAHEEFLASDALRGRGSATPDEWVAAVYIGSELREFGVEPAAPDGSYVQQIALDQKRVTKPPVLKVGSAASKSALVYGKDFAVLRLGGSFAGPLQKIDISKRSGAAASKGAVVLLVSSSSGDGPDAQAFIQQAVAATRVGAAAILLPGLKAESSGATPLPELEQQIKSAPAEQRIQFNVLPLSDDAVKKLSGLADGVPIKLEMHTKDAAPRFTYNAMGILRGSDPELKSQVILLTAHLDHLGVGKPVNGDNIYNGADDDASGVTAVLELARALA
ncbi:MAG TPA: M28 family peptidase, partial [Terriglobales bacterium]